MPYYHSLGDIPHKRHTVFKQKNGKGFYQEHLVGSYGFSGPQSLLYRVYPPTEVIDIKKIRPVSLQGNPADSLRMRHFRLAALPDSESQTLSRSPVLFNSDLSISFCQTDKSDDFFYRNAQADEMIFVSSGSGVLESEYGNLPFRSGDHIIIHRSITYRLNLKEYCQFLIVESNDLLRPPDRYMNGDGQFLENSPYCERDIRIPSELMTNDDRGEYRVVVKRDNFLHEVLMAHHPFDVVGWDGCYYPWIFNIEDFEPITGRVHQPPPVHQTFAAAGFVTCAFVPRLFDYHPDAIPAPYNHSNVMSDEVLYYANDEFMSRKGIEYGSLTHHPFGLPHGPQPGKMEQSIGAKSTNELAVMIDTFKPLLVPAEIMDVEDKDYGKSWLLNDE
ncbi:MAG: homogentisate 1,2-dioxygenase [Candidatus Electryonea clarkiae]|nr:homogentisate 1,2-dioxygenase [Candidatus Electryonea clarkiae]MDP8286738.1 homogentisate 1,2-dioxygenase [Candidatus Electryonea clarkiae]